VTEEKCYKCDNKATGREHVPPLCIFPEKKDIGEDYRKNLITVPSCDDHNLKKTKDDEFLMTLITGHVKNNFVAYKQTKSKLKRALDRKYDGFINSLLKDSKELNIKTSNETVFPVITGVLDLDRVKKCIEQIAVGLYFHEFGKQFKGDFKVVYDFVKYEDENTNKLIPYFHDIYKKSVDKFPFKGDNPKIFYYQMIPPNEFGIIGLKLSFFEGTHFFTSLKLENSPEPFDLGLKMIQDGIKTTIKFDGKDYDFN